MEQLLPGGFVNAVVRVGDTVRRPPSPNAGFVHDLLDHLERHGWTGTPRYLGADADGREILSFLEGHVAWEDRQPAEVGSDASLAEVARLARQLHDLTAGTPGRPRRGGLPQRPVAEEHRLRRPRARATPGGVHRPGAGGVSRPGRRPATRPCGGFVTGALAEPSGPTRPG